MSRASAAGNGVVKAVEDVCGLFGVPVLRMQTRTFTVPGAGGRERPFFVGEWTDAMGVKHRKGMADLLLMPQIRIKQCLEHRPQQMLYVTIPLWVECKAGSGKLEKDQREFKDWVMSIGAAYLCVTDSCEALMDWFKNYGVEKP